MLRRNAFFATIGASTSSPQAFQGRRGVLQREDLVLQLLRDGKGLNEISYSNQAWIWVLLFGISVLDYSLHVFDLAIWSYKVLIWDSEFFFVWRVMAAIYGFSMVVGFQW